MEKYYSASVRETESIARAFAANLRPGDVVAFFGDLGAGKTAFTRGIVAALAPEAEVTSPTFTFLNQYTGNVTINHFDMYRVASYDDLYNIGFFDCVGPDSITIIEWSENIPFALPEDAYHVTIRQGDEPDSRSIEIDRRESVR